MVSSAAVPTGRRCSQSVHVYQHSCCHLKGPAPGLAALGGHKERHTQCCCSTEPAVLRLLLLYCQQEMCWPSLFHLEQLLKNIFICFSSYVSSICGFMFLERFFDQLLHSPLVQDEETKVLKWAESSDGRF